MKKFILFTAIIINISYIKASEHSIGSAEIISKEVNYVTGIFDCTITLNANQNFKLIAIPTIKVPAGWNAVITPVLPGLFVCYKDIPNSFKVVVTYPITNLPFYPQSISVTMPVQSLADTALRQILTANGKVYFTPYNTIEVFSIADFENSNRVWLNEQANGVQSRVYIAKSNVPVSDFNIATDTVGGKDMESIPAQLLWVKGLAYAIPKKLLTDSMYIEDFDDGLDSAGTASQTMADDLTNALLSASNTSQTASAPLTASQLKALRIKFPRIRIPIKINLPSIPVITKQFKGTVTGRLTSTITNDLGQRVNIPLSGVLVNLYEKDKIADELFGSTHTNAQGYYTITYDKTQSFLEGNTIELYIELKSKNKSYDITAKKMAVLGLAYNEIIDIGSKGTNAGTITKNINSGISAFRPINWATRSWEYSQNNGIPLKNDLAILPHAKSSYFLADGFLGVSIPGSKPVIRLSSADCNHENTMYHEFGHFQMWNVQGFNDALVIQKGSNHTWSEENTSRLAWSEGWANAYGMIMDAAHWWEDKEYGFDETSKTIAVFEQRISGWQKNKGGQINNGLWAEYYIGCAIYDLWDGAGKGVPITLPNGTKVGYDDKGTGGWQTEDNVELSFKTIVQPLINRPLLNPLTNIYEYYGDLMSSISDCSLRTKVATAFTENRVVYDITNYELLKGYGAMTVSTLHEEKRATIIGTVFDKGDMLIYTDTYYLTYLQPEASKTIDYHYFSVPSPALEHFIQYGNSSKTSHVKINANAGTYYATEARLPYPNANSGTLYTCGKSGFNMQRGILELGAATGYSINLEVRDQGLVKINSLGSLIVNNGSSLIVKSGGTLHIKAGAILTINTGGSIIVESGGYVCIESGAVITNANLLTVSSSANIGTNPVLGITSSNCINNFCTFSAITNAQALSFDGINDGVEIANNSILNLGTGSFTLEAYIKSNKTSAFTHQVILSKRNSSDTDGFMMGIWQTGTLWIQLKGAPNLGIDNGPNLLDGNCHHVAISRNSSNLLKFYVDGILTFQTTAAARDISSTGNLRIGRDIISGLNFDGFIGEIRIWNTERTLTQLQNNINQTLSPQTNLMALWDMKGYNQTVTDVSGKGNNGTLGSTTGCENNDPVWVSASNVACSAGDNFRAIDDGENSPWIILPSMADSSQTLQTFSVQVFPNPFSNAINIEITDAIGDAVSIEIKNMAGQTVCKQLNCPSDKILTFGDDLSAGIYLLQVHDGSTIKIVKIVKTN